MHTKQFRRPRTGDTETEGGDIWRTGMWNLLSDGTNVGDGEARATEYVDRAGRVWNSCALYLRCFITYMCSDGHEVLTAQTLSENNFRISS